MHPHDAKEADEVALAEIAALARDAKVVAVGETGLDYHYDNSTPEAQKRALAAHREIARDLDKPLVLHIREAHADALAILDDAPALPRGGVVHCFTGTPAEAEQWLARGYLLSFSGIATFPQAEALRDAARLCPADRLLLETDAPYLAPVPVRGRKNEPANVAFTCAHLAGVRREDPAALAVQAGANARAFFRLPAPPAREANPPPPRPRRARRLTPGAIAGTFPVPAAPRSSLIPT
ncbi:TatD family hydrolase [Nannocystis pusilla]|uniref:TatD family hydrolase n=1 Tax=Nannocystis pusilla TaxID=889268 RepID=UPI003B79ABFF